MLLIRYILIFSEKVKALERRKRTESMPTALRLCCWSIRALSPTRSHHTTMRSLSHWHAVASQKFRSEQSTRLLYTHLVNVFFPELERFVPTLHMKSVYALLSEFPGAAHIASAHLTRLSHLLQSESKGHYEKAKAIEIHEAARSSIGSVMPAKSLEFSHTINLINIKRWD